MMQSNRDWTGRQKKTPSNTTAGSEHRPPPRLRPACARPAARELILEHHPSHSARRVLTREPSLAHDDPRAASPAPALHTLPEEPEDAGHTLGTSYSSWPISASLSGLGGFGRSKPSAAHRSLADPVRLFTERLF